MSAKRSERVYLRRLPGGGYVAIEIARLRRWFHKACYRGTVLVERRSGGDPERTLHPLVVAEASADDAESVLRALLPAAECNPAIGSALLNGSRVVRYRSPHSPAARHVRVRGPQLARNVRG